MAVPGPSRTLKKEAPMSITTRQRRVSAAVALLAALQIAAAVPSSAEPDGACTTPDGVTVVVDSTDLGGEVLVGCGEGATTGTEVLRAAGFTETRDESGLICAIDALPDPCPAEFTGSYWSYWFADADTGWQMYQEGSDTAHPEAGSVEGWRYNDGSQGPGVAPEEALAATPTADPESPGSDSAGSDAATPDDESDGWTPAEIGFLALMALWFVWVVREKRRGQAQD